MPLDFCTLMNEQETAFLRAVSGMIEKYFLLYTEGNIQK